MARQLLWHKDYLAAIAAAKDDLQEALKKVKVCKVYHYCFDCHGEFYYEFEDLIQHLFDFHDQHLVLPISREYIEEYYIGRQFSCTECSFTERSLEKSIIHFAKHHPFC